MTATEIIIGIFIVSVIIIMITDIYPQLTVKKDYKPVKKYKKQSIKKVDRN